MQGQEEELEKAAGLSSRAAKQRVRTVRLRNTAGLGKNEVPDDLGENRSSGLEARLQGLRSEWVERKWRQRV